MGDEMGSALAMRILDDLAAFGVKSVTFSGGGEPLLHPAFPTIVMHAKKRGLALGLYTNATLLTRESHAGLDGFIKRNFDFVVVSLDAANAAAYKAAKQVDAFEDACAGVRALAGAEGDAVIAASFLLDAANYRDLWAMYDLSRKLGADYAEFRPIVHFSLGAPDTPSADTAWIGAARVMLADIGQRPDVYVAHGKFRRLHHWQRGYATCHGILFTGVITPNGKVWTCVNRRGFPDSAVGDLAAESFADVWARQKSFAVDGRCRVLCRADSLNVLLDSLAQPLPHEAFI